MKKSFITTLVVILVGIGTASAQQIPMFNSYTLNKFLINPSYAGANGKTNIYGINRIQYAGFDGAPITYMFTADAGFKDKKFGLGGMLFSDRNNLIAQNGFQLSYAYTVKLNDKWNVGMGLNAGAVQWTLNLDQLKIDDPTEAVLSNYKSNATTFRSDLGLRLSSDKIEFGFALPQVVSSKVKYSDYVRNSNGKYTTVPHYVANLSYLLSLGNDINIKPMVVVRGAKGVKPQIDVVGMLDWKSKAYATLGYRTNYAVSIGGGVRLTKGVTFGYVYDRPVNNIGKYSSGSHEIVVGITLGSKGSAEEKPEPANDFTKEAEAKLKADIEQKLSANYETRLKQELDLRVSKAVDEKIAKAFADRPVSTASNDGKTTTTTTTASVSKEELEKIKKDIEEKIRKQMDENYTKLIDEKIKKAIESKPTTPVAAAQPSKEETERLRKESEEKIRKEVEEKLRKELTDKISQSIQERMDKDAQKAKEEALKAPKEYKMTAKDKAVLDSLKMTNVENQRKIAYLEIQLKNFPESDRIENEQLREITRIVHQNDIEMKDFKAKNRVILEGAKDAPPSKKTEETETVDEHSKFILVLACFKTLKEAQFYQKLATQTFEFPNTKVLKPSQPEGWYFVYQKSFDKKKMAWEAHTKISESKFNTPNFPWIYVTE